MLCQLLLVRSAVASSASSLIANSAISSARLGRLAARALARSLDPVGLARQLQQLSEELLGDLIASGYEAVGLVVEELIEGVARHARRRDDLWHRRGLVAVAPHALEHRAHDARTLGLAHRGGRELVAPPRQRLCAPLNL